MDKNMLKFWASLLNSAAESQEAMENMNKLMTQGLHSSAEMQQMFMKFYFPENKQQASPPLENAEQSFQEAYKRFLSLFQVVPKTEYEALEKRYQALQETTRKQEDTIRELKKRIAASGVETLDASKDFQEIMRSQSEQFQNLMESFSNLVLKGGDEPENQ